MRQREIAQEQACRGGMNRDSHYTSMLRQARMKCPTCGAPASVHTVPIKNEPHYFHPGSLRRHTKSKFCPVNPNEKP